MVSISDNVSGFISFKIYIQMRILVIANLDSRHPAPQHFTAGFVRLGHVVEVVNLAELVQLPYWIYFFDYRLGFPLTSRIVCGKIAMRIVGKSFDMAFVWSGETINSASLGFLRNISRFVVNYNFDDPTGTRDGNRWRLFLKNIKNYHLCVVVRNESEQEYPAFGVKRILRVWRSADEVSHAKREITDAIQGEWASDISFVGTWMPERGPFMCKLIEAGMKISIWGNRWHKDPQWLLLKPFWRGPSLVGDEYAYAIQCSKLCLGMLSAGNRDSHTTRTAEIPSLGGLFFAQRTCEHEEMYLDGCEAIFWNDADDCLAKAKYWLAKDLDAKRKQIAESGRLKWLNGPMRNEAVAKKILAQLFEAN